MADNQDLVSYNGYNFNPYSDISLNAVLVDDDAGRTTLYQRWKLRVESTIYAEDGDTPGQAGEHFRTLRTRLTKKGMGLTIHHAGFHDGPFEVNVLDTGRRDVAFGPHPRVVVWEDIGHENAVHVVWECEFCVSDCSRWSGIMALNFHVSTRVDIAGYSTRTVAGYIEIAMSRIQGRSVPDTADAYRDKIVMQQLHNFHREHTWNVSPDRRRADFTIVDTQIRSPNAFAPGVVNITGNHSASWSRRQAAILPQSIRATIELQQGQPRSRAWEIFRAIVQSRLRFVGTGTVFLENLYVDESLFGDSFTFSVQWRLFMEPNESVLTALAGLFTSTGIGAPLNIGTWQQWKQSILPLQSHRGQAGLVQKAENDKIIDLCATELQASNGSDTARVPYTPPARSGQRLFNVKPSARKSYLKYDTYIQTDEEVPTTIQVNVGEDDLKLEEFDPNKPDATLGTTTSGSQIRRFVESQSGRVEVVWKGYAERVGYPIPRPDRLELGGVVLTRVGRAQFVQKFQGNVLGQPVYAAAWNQRYVVSKRPEKMDDISEWGDS